MDRFIRFLLVIHDLALLDLAFCCGLTGAGGGNVISFLTSIGDISQGAVRAMTPANEIGGGMGKHQSASDGENDVPMGDDPRYWTETGDFIDHEPMSGAVPHFDKSTFPTRVRIHPTMKVSNLLLLPARRM